MNNVVTQLKEAGQDFEWYPTTNEMIVVVRHYIPENAKSILDIGAGDGRVLGILAEKCKKALLYSIEKSTILQQKQPANIIPLGTNIHEQNLASLQVEYIFCNPIYSEFEEWMSQIIKSGYAKKAFLIVPQRWKASFLIKKAIKDRGATTRVLYSGDFRNAERSARAEIDIVEISFPKDEEGWHGEVKDPFDIWFDANVDTFEKVEPLEEDKVGSALRKRVANATLEEIVAAYQEEHALLIEHYQAIFKLDQEILRELGIDKNAVREGLKMKIAGLKVTYWGILFDRLDAITSRLTTKSKAALLKKLTHNIEGRVEDDRHREIQGSTIVEFTSTNAYAVILWAIKNANAYFDEQAVELFRALSTYENVLDYKSNDKTWGKDHWRYMRWSEYDAFRTEHGTPKASRYALDYRIVIEHSRGIGGSDNWEYPGNLYKDYHDLLADIKAVLDNLGFSTHSKNSKDRIWKGGQWQDFYHSDSEEVLYQAKAFMNGNMHMRFMPEVIKALNVYVSRVLKWTRTVEDVIVEMDIPVEEAIKYFNHNPYLQTSNVKLLNG